MQHFYYFYQLEQIQTAHVYVEEYFRKSCYE